MRVCALKCPNSTRPPSQELAPNRSRVLNSTHPHYLTEVWPWPWRLTLFCFNYFHNIEVSCVCRWEQCPEQVRSSPDDRGFRPSGGKELLGGAGEAPRQRGPPCGINPLPDSRNHHHHHHLSSSSPLPSLVKVIGHIAITIGATMTRAMTQTMTGSQSES